MPTTTIKDASIDMDDQLKELERAGIVVVEDDELSESVRSEKKQSSISMEDLKKDLVRHGGIEFLHNDYNFEPKWKVD